VAHFEELNMRKHLLASAMAIAAAAWIGGCDMDHHDDAHDMHHDMESMHTNMWSGVTHAVAVLQPLLGSNITGTIMFDQVGDKVHITGDIRGLAPNSKHGFHIHEFGDTSAANGSSAGGHYNPEGAEHMHGAIDNPKRHAGDLGNITADGSGVAHIDVTDDDISIAGMKNPIIGRGIVVHANEDDYTQSPPSQTPGNAGGRVAVGVIGIRKAP
jgi:Cu-Zn family superoxide dismutase